MPPETSDEETDFCKALGDLAETIMTARQEGASLSDMMGRIKDSEIADIQRKIILAAYEEPRWATEETKKEAIEDFRNEIELECYKGN